MTIDLNLRKQKQSRKIFVATDHNISLDTVIRALNSELQWCHQNPMPENIDIKFRDGFIKGIEQSKYLIIEIAKKLNVGK